MSVDSFSSRIFEKSAQNAAALKDRMQPVYVLGTNAWAASLCDVFDVRGFIDDFTSETHFHSLPIVSAADIEPDKPLISANVLGRPITALARCFQATPLAIDYFSLLQLKHWPLKEVLWGGEFADEYRQHKDFYRQLLDVLADEKSKYVLESIINFRLTRDLSRMRGFTDSQYRQYMEPFLNFQAPVRFWDVGGFDGHTSVSLAKYFTNYQTISIFEPIPDNRKNIERAIASLRNTSVYDVFLSDAPKMARFTSAGSSSMLNDQGDIEVKGVAADDLDIEPPTYLKMDIEGGEAEALAGLAKTIEVYKPNMAISVYHKAQDIRAIYQQVMSIRDDYRFYIRHYTEGVTETVMFFVT